MSKQWIADRKVPGLGVMVLPSGVRTWYLRYREPSGKQQHHRIGRADSVNVTTAREQAHKILAAVATGQAPTSARQERRRAPTVAQLLERIKREHWRKLRPGSVVNNELIWRRHLLPEFGALKVSELQQRHVADWFHRASLERPVRANRCLEVLSKAMNLAELWELRPAGSNPCVRLNANSERKRRRYLTREELKRLLSALDTFAEAGVRWRFAQLIRLLLVTGCRVREVMCARWDWLDLDAAVLLVPAEAGARVAFLADVENLSFELARPAARLVLNSRTGSVVFNEAVTIGPCAVAHGNLTVTISTTPVVSQPNAFGQGQTVQAEKSDIAIAQEGNALVHLPAGTRLSEVVKALNALGATPADLQAILQAMKSAGALHAEIEVI
jgi:hypothetical protein